MSEADHDIRSCWQGTFEMEVYTPNEQGFPEFFSQNVLDNTKTGKMTLEFQDKDGKTFKVEGKILPTSASIAKTGKYNERTEFILQYMGTGELKR